MIASLEAHLKSCLAQITTPGISLSVSWGHESQDLTLGFQDREHTQPLTSEPMYIYSIQKPLLASPGCHQDNLN